MKTLLVKLDSVRRCKERGFNVSEQINRTSRKFAGRVIKIFKNLPKSLEWRSFYINDLPILMDIYEEVQKVSIQPQLSEKCSISVKRDALLKFNISINLYKKCFFAYELYIRYGNKNSTKVLK